MSRNFPIVEIAACADLNRAAAQKKAEEFQIPRVLTVDEILADDSIEVILNLTVPKAHGPIALRALEAGKHTYAEKPLGIARDEGRAILDKAREKNLLVGCAPDTFMGAGIQTARKAIDAGLIGKPVAFTAFMMGPGHENWHPSPEFYYEIGGGPMFDMGPYYLTALLNLLGPIQRVSGMASIAIPERTITSQPKSGQKMTVQTPDHIVGSIEFQQGAVGTIITSFATRFPQYDGSWPITIFGTEGTMLVPDPNRFSGLVKIRNNGDPHFREIPPVFEHDYGRSIGLADMAYAIRTSRPFRASGDQAFAVLDVMQGFLESSQFGHEYRPVTNYERPAPMPTDLPFAVLDEI
jgi:predicted dehydrogenase